MSKRKRALRVREESYAYMYVQGYYKALPKPEFITKLWLVSFT